MPSYKEIQKGPWRATQRKADSIEQRRALVVRAINNWTQFLLGSGPKPRLPLSKLEGEDRLTRVMYGTIVVPLNEKGDITGVIDANDDEIAFWNELKEEVLKGRLDYGINFAADWLSLKIKSGRARRKTVLAGLAGAGRSDH